jgi:two-component system nitrogen regulation response regulator GlnG
MSNVLIVDDEPAICWAFEQALREDGHEVCSASSAEQAIAKTETFRPDVILLDVRLPGTDGITAMKELNARLSTTPIIIMTAFGSLETAVKALGSGAFEYLPKPFDLDEAIGVVTRALESAEIQSSSSASDQGAISPKSGLVGSSPVMQALFRQIALVATRDVPVLITGESGTGKDLVAQAIHHHGHRATGPFVPICVPALSSMLMESELFGHVKGAFTGADTDRKGFLDLASGGTAFLDELGDIPITTQVKLLRVLETKTNCPVGSAEWKTTNFRLIAATNRDIEQLVAKDEFREDLYYRLNVFRIEVPPLRERLDDVPILASHFLRVIDSENELELSSEAVAELVSRPWLGNVRELRNAIEHAVVVARSRRIVPQDLPPPISDNEVVASPTNELQQAVKRWIASELCTASVEDVEGLLDKFLADCEPTILRQVLIATDGNRQAAARVLGMHRQTLREKLRKYPKDAGS